MVEIVQLRQFQALVRLLLGFVKVVQGTLVPDQLQKPEQLIILKDLGT